MDTGHPVAEVAIDAALVRTLLAEQHPDLADEPIVIVDEGWDNVTCRLGDDLAVRVPRREAAVELLLNEQCWLPVLGPRLDIAVPVPVRLGVQGPAFRWPWSVVEWIDGVTADAEAVDPSQAERLGRILRALHRPAPPEAPGNPFRGVPLSARSDFVTERIDAFRDRSADEASTLHALWRTGVEAPPAEERVWIHGDLHPRNVLVQAGMLVGVIDWGDLTAGDPATDLAAAWMLFPSFQDREALWTSYGPGEVADGPASHRSASGDEALSRRARAWAVFFGVALSTSGEDRHERIGRSILDTLLNECR